MTSTISISEDRLKELLLAEVRRQNIKAANLQIDHIMAVSESGETYPLAGIRVASSVPQLHSKTTVQRSAPAAKGRLKLVAVDGETL